MGCISMAVAYPAWRDDKDFLHSAYRLRMREEVIKDRVKTVTSDGRTRREMAKERSLHMSK